MTFDASGVVWHAGVVPANELRPMRACLERAMRDLPLVDEGSALRPGPGTEHAMAEVVQDPAFDALAVHLARILDAGWAPATGAWRGVALPNLPGSQATWDVPHQHWHADDPTSVDRAEPWSVGAFVFLDRVAAGGGATLVMTGSPRRLRAGPCTLDELARIEPWIDALLQPGPDPDTRHRRFMTEGCVSAGIPLRIVELTGEPGDIVLMDLRCLHAPSANVSAQPRLVVKMACVNEPTG